MIKCANCRRMVPANSRVKNQKYCNRKACQHVRKNKWKQSKIASDPDYKNDQRDYHYRNYRKQNPDYCDRNRELQKKRDKKRRLKQSCKRDALKQFSVIKPGTYRLIPFDKKRDALGGQIVVIPRC
jgi:hypothetical protein